MLLCVQTEPGIVGNDGETHQGLFDMASFAIVPNITIMAPKDFKELEQMMEFAVKANCPIFIRYPRGGEGKIQFEIHQKIEMGKSELIKYGTDVSIR